jgi:GNAT superfamily N-acetyltransferase
VSALCTIREARAGDAPFILSSWLHSFRAESKQLGQENGYLDPDTYGTGHRRLIQRAFDAGQVYVATAPDDDDTLYGWACGSPGVLHYAFVKLDLRGRGFAKALIQQTVQTPRWRCTHYTSAVKRWKAAGLATYDPYPLWCPE